MSSRPPASSVLNTVDMDGKVRRGWTPTMEDILACDWIVMPKNSV